MATRFNLHTEYDKYFMTVHACSLEEAIAVGKKIHPKINLKNGPARTAAKGKTTFSCAMKPGAGMNKKPKANSNVN